MCFFLLYPLFFVAIALFSQSRFVVFGFFLFFWLFFVTIVGSTIQGNGIMTQSSSHMQQLNAANEVHNIGGGMGVFSGASDRSIGQN